MSDEVNEVVQGDGYAVANVDALGDGPGFRKVRRQLGVTAFGVNAIELPPGFETGRHYHDEQEELYFVHRGRIQIRLNDESEHVLGPGGLARVDAATVRQIKNVGDEPAVYLVAGGKDGYVGRDGQLPEGETSRFGPAGRPAELYGSVAIGAAVLAGCPVFPAENHWNLRVDRLPVHPRSDAIVRSIGASDNMHADFGSGRYEGAPIGIPFVTVPGGQRRVPVSFDYADESDGGRYPIPPRAPIEGGRGSDGDRHVIVVDRSRCRLYELFDAHSLDGGARWHAGSGAIFNLRSNRLRPRGHTSADAAGLPILPGLARYGEVRRGRIVHALRFTASRTRRAFVYPARHFASDLTDPDLPAMGQRLRLKQGFDISRFPRQPRIVLRALKRYGMILADNGSSWYVSGAPSRGWDNDDLHALHGVPGSAFEVVDTSRLPRP